jgi:hypothetical protein
MVIRDGNQLNLISIATENLINAADEEQEKDEDIEEEDDEEDI